MVFCVEISHVKRSQPPLVKASLAINDVIMSTPNPAIRAKILPYIRSFAFSTIFPIQLASPTTSSLLFPTARCQKDNPFFQRLNQNLHHRKFPNVAKFVQNCEPTTSSLHCKMDISLPLRNSLATCIGFYARVFLNLGIEG